jgi:hypothetical protein
VMFFIHHCVGSSLAKGWWCVFNRRKRLDRIENSVHKPVLFVCCYKARSLLQWWPLSIIIDPSWPPSSLKTSTQRYKFQRALTHTQREERRRRLPWSHDLSTSEFLLFLLWVVSFFLLQSIVVDFSPFNTYYSGFILLYCSCY